MCMLTHTHTLWLMYPISFTGTEAEKWAVRCRRPRGGQSLTPISPPAKQHLSYLRLLQLVHFVFLTPALVLETYSDRVVSVFGLFALGHPLRARRHIFASRHVYLPSMSTLGARFYSARSRLGADVPGEPADSISVWECVHVHWGGGSVSESVSSARDLHR